MAETTYVSLGRKAQQAAQLVKASTGVSSKDITDEAADNLLAAGKAFNEAELRASKGVRKICLVTGIHESTKAFAPSKKTGVGFRSLGVYLEIDNHVALYWIPELESAPLNATVGNYITVPMAQIPVGGVTVRYKGTEEAPDGALETTYAKGGWVPAGENNAFGNVSTEQQLFILAKTVNVATSTKVLEKAGR